MNLKEQALAFRRQVKTAAVPMPEWGQGQIVTVRELTAAERDAYEADQTAKSKAGRGLVNFRARLVALTACDNAGERIFSDGDVEALGELPSSQVRKLFDAAVKLNGLSAEEEKDLEKNS